MKKDQTIEWLQTNNTKQNLENHMKEGKRKYNQ